jgi:hypothetical protein
VSGFCAAAATGSPCKAGGDCSSQFCDDINFNPPQCG